MRPGFGFAFLDVFVGVMTVLAGGGSFVTLAQ